MSREYSSNWISSTSKDILFTCFPKLPPELRHKIWHNACSVPRLIDLWPKLTGPAETAQDFFEEFEIPPFILKSHCQRIPPILHTSKEAREVGLQNYELSFGTAFNQSMHGARFLITKDPEIYVNWKYDIIYLIILPNLDPDQWLNHLLVGEMNYMAKLSRIAIEIKDVDHMKPLFFIAAPDEIMVLDGEHGELGTEFDPRDYLEFILSSLDECTFEHTEVYNAVTSLRAAFENYGEKQPSWHAPLVKPMGLRVRQRT